ncbi:hypothetical protein CL615_00295 [archaeon]|jgi:hypothetical protein|nr:hypothetical protein [archaeon]MDP6547426.1 hypothetical protein [Candidatus Woesearchaeota archaeon]|tara:strand:- start:21675 stop:22382 length:708 start_codon:yes stop_codon:yes gene_type:complete
MIANLTQFIHETVNRDGVIMQGLSRNLITPRALAAYIIKTNPDKNLSLESVRTAIRRCDTDFSEIKDINKPVYGVLKDSKIHLKSGVVRVSFKKGDASLELINRSLKTLEIYGGDTFRVIKGQNILTILVDEGNLEKVRHAFSERILDIEKDLCEISIIVPKEAYKQYGMNSVLLNEITINKINVVSTFSCGTEMNVYVYEKDSQKTFNILGNMLERIKNEMKLEEKKKKGRNNQ